MHKQQPGILGVDTVGRGELIQKRRGWRGGLGWCVWRVGVERMIKEVGICQFHATFAISVGKPMS